MGKSAVAGAFHEDKVKVFAAGRCPCVYQAGHGDDVYGGPPTAA